MILPWFSFGKKWLATWARRLGIRTPTRKPVRRRGPLPRLMMLEDRLVPASTSISDSLAGFIRITPEDTETTVSLVAVADADNP
ncbi:MAG: hypothetical protein KJS91_06635, partial [Planctomycetes bacterium]|nr:hypothetical protein [Planctomycetota bacterium]